MSGKVRPGPAASVTPRLVLKVVNVYVCVDYDPMGLSGAAATRKEPMDVCGKRGYPGSSEITWYVMQGFHLQKFYKKYRSDCCRRSRRSHHCSHSLKVVPSTEHASNVIYYKVKASRYQAIFILSICFSFALVISG
jgi:hypothetical protein